MRVFDDYGCEQFPKFVSRTPGSSRYSTRARFAGLLSACIALASLSSFGEIQASPLCDSLTAGRYDVLYICPAAWRTQVARLAIYRRGPTAGDYTSIIAPAESIATCYGSGRAGIRAMLHSVLSTWNPLPRHVVLVGGFSNSDTYSTLDTAVYIIPTWFRPDPAIGFWTPFVPTDDPYVYAPASTDSIPVVPIGRIPAWSASDLGIYIDKVVAYESAGTPVWKKTALHVIEDRDLDGNDGSLARRHADSLATHFGQREANNFTRSHLYGTDASPDANAPVIAAWNAGVGYALFYGTGGSPNILGFFRGNGGNCGSPHNDAYDSLLQNGRMAVIFGLTCGAAYPSGAIDQPSRCQTLTQYLLFAPSAGAVSITGPTRALHEIPGYALAKAWYQTVFGSGQLGFYREPGPALQSAKQLLIPGLPAYRTEVMGFMVLGDPALQFYVGGEQVVSVGDEPGRLPNTLSVRQIRFAATAVQLSMDAPRAGSYDFVLYDVQGRQITRGSVVVDVPGFDKRFTITLRESRAGVYFLRGQGAGLVSTTKLVILN